jgi:hypothetical protein
VWWGKLRGALIGRKKNGCIFLLAGTRHDDVFWFTAATAASHGAICAWLVGRRDLSTRCGLRWAGAPVSHAVPFDGLQPVREVVCEENKVGSTLGIPIFKSFRNAPAPPGAAEGQLLMAALIQDLP